MNTLEPLANVFIEFNRDPAEYSPREILRGCVVIQAAQKVLVSKMEVNISAQTNLRWIDKETGLKNGSMTEHFCLRQDLFENYFELLDLDDQLLIGRHEIPFEFALPDGLPENFECEFGSTRYVCVAQIFGPNMELLQDCQALFSLLPKNQRPMKTLSSPQHGAIKQFPIWDHDQSDAHLKNIQIF